MSNERHKWIMNYKFLADYPSEQSWKAAFEQFKTDLKEYDAKNKQ